MERVESVNEAQTKYSPLYNGENYYQQCTSGGWMVYKIIKTTKAVSDLHSIEQT